MRDINVDILFHMLKEQTIENSYMTGKWIEHYTLGRGIIESINDCYYNIQFEGEPVKTYKADIDKFLNVELPKNITGVDELISKTREICLRERHQKELELQIKTARDFIEALSPRLFTKPQYHEISNIPVELEDIKLALQWSKNTDIRFPYGNVENVLTELVETRFPDKDIKKYGFEFVRCLSARIAEKAAKKFYENYGRKVSDIAITQLNRVNDSEWSKYDIHVDGVPVDVKNSRSTYNHTDRYVEHYIKAFKIDAAHNEVIIAGTLSSYIAIDNLDVDSIKRSTILFLGEISSAKLEKLKEEFKIPDFFLIDEEELEETKRTLLPPWVFSYPKYTYETGPAAVAELSANDIRLLGRAGLPLSLMVGINIADTDEIKRLPEWELEFYKDIISHINKMGCTLPVIYLTILRHFFKMVFNSASNNQGYTPEMYNKYLYYQESDRSMPLGIFDPLRTIPALLNVIRILWKDTAAVLKPYDLLKLTGFNILKGRCRDNHGRWESIIAYCGGWNYDKNPIHPCGTIPLILHKRGDTCRECGMLICPECHCCWKGCEDYDRRMQGIEGYERKLYSSGKMRP